MMNHIRYHKNDVTVLECSPQRRTISIEDCFHVRNYYLAFPWMVFILRRSLVMHTVGVGFRNSELTDADQTIYHPHLYNVLPYTLRVCMDECRWEKGEEWRVLDAFWCSTFTSVLDGLYLLAGAYSLDSRVRTHEVWQRHTLENPSFITTVCWPRCNELPAMLKKYGPW